MAPKRRARDDAVPAAAETAVAEVAAAPVRRSYTVPAATMLNIIVCVVIYAYTHRPSDDDLVDVTSRATYALHLVFGGCMYWGLTMSYVFRVPLAGILFVAYGPDAARSAFDVQWT